MAEFAGLAYLPEKNTIFITYASAKQRAQCKVCIMWENFPRRVPHRTGTSALPVTILDTTTAICVTTACL